MAYLEGDKKEEAMRWLEVAAEAARQSLCQNRHCGTVIVADGVVIGQGYNAPALDKEANRRCNHSFGPGKPNFDMTCCIHAEWRAIMDALRRNPDKIVGSTLYFTAVDDSGAIAFSGKPCCTACSRMALDAGLAVFVLWHEEGIVEYPTDQYDYLSYTYELSEKDKQKYRDLRL